MGRAICRKNEILSLLEIANVGKDGERSRRSSRAVGRLGLLKLPEQRDVKVNFGEVEPWLAYPL